MSPTWTRLNTDATWHLCFGGVAVLFDPWLIGDEVDYAGWFNTARHVGPVIAPPEAPAFDAIVISQHYADHLHPETLRALPPAPVFAVPQAVAALRRFCADVRPIPAWGEPAATLGDLRLWRLSRPWHRPPAYHAIVLADGAGDAVLHAPHGLPASEAAAVAARHRVRLLALTRRAFVLPWWLGGAVGPGPDAADAAVAACRPDVAFPLHDEPKAATGLVSRLARVTEPPPAAAPWVDPPVGVAQG